MNMKRKLVMDMKVSRLVVYTSSEILIEKSSQNGLYGGHVRIVCVFWIQKGYCIRTTANEDTNTNTHTYHGILKHISHVWRKQVLSKMDPVQGFCYELEYPYSTYACRRRDVSDGFRLLWRRNIKIKMILKEDTFALHCTVPTTFIYWTKTNLIISTQLPTADTAEDDCVFPCKKRGGDLRQLPNFAKRRVEGSWIMYKICSMIWELILRNIFFRGGLQSFLSYCKTLEALSITNSYSRQTE